MGKDKRVFPFRKHSVGNHLHKRKLKKGMGVVLAAALLFGTLPSEWLTAAASEGGAAGLCEHHTEHTADCGYREAAPCTHEHTDGCYTEKTSCVHEHNADCYGGELPAEGEDKEVVSCTHVCTKDSGCITRELNCTHEHDGSCSYAEAAPCGYVCEICNGEEADGGQETTESTTGGESAEGNKTEEDTIEESTSEENDTGENVPEEESEEGLCPHHEKHTEDCGYGEDTPCGYVCKICPVQELIDALPDAEEITAENAADVEELLAKIDGAKAELTDEELDALDTTKYEAAVSALLALEDMAGADKIQALADGSVTENDTTWEDRTYTVTGNITLINRVTVKGTVTLQLNEGCKLTASQGINVPPDSSLTIKGDGELEATGGNAQAGIGGNSKESSGIITINGGNVTATGGTAAAGIGGGWKGSGTVIINGGTVTATSGPGNSSDYGGAGIGGGSDGSGTVTITGGNVTATCGTRGGGAGIGGGTNCAGTVTISGTAQVEATGGKARGGGGAGIGGGESNKGIVTISGTAQVEAVGSGGGAGIGSGSGGDAKNSEVTITGGVVTATSTSGAGIGDGQSGSGSTFSTVKDGVAGKAWIETSSISDTDDTSTWSGIIFQGNNGGVYGNQTLNSGTEIPSGKTLTVTKGATLTISSGATLTSNNSLTIAPGGSITGGGTITGEGTFTTKNLTTALISVPTDLVYNGDDQSENIKNGLKLPTDPVSICGKDFQFDATGWVPSVAKSDDSELQYTVTYIHDGDSSTAVTKTVTLGQSATQFGDGAVKTYHGNTEASEFTYGETFNVKATPMATGQAPTAVRSRLKGLTSPGSGQMAVYCGGTQVSDAADADGNGSYTMTVSVKDLIDAGAEYGSVTLTVKFVENDYMAGASGEVDVTLKPATLTITGAMLAAKTYDGTNTGTVNEVTLSDVVDGDSLSMGEDSDYTATAEFADENAGENKSAIVTVTLTNHNYTFADGKKEATYTLNGQTISQKAITPAVKLSADSFMWDNDKEIKPAVTVTYTEGSEEITIPDTEYKVEYSGNKDVGEATATVIGIKNYEFTATANFTITCPHTNVKDGVCQICSESIVATVESGGKTTYYTDITSAWDYANGKTATITMLQSQTVNEMLEMTSGNVTLTMESGVTLSGTVNQNGLICVKDGILTLDGCTIESQNAKYASVFAPGTEGGGTVVNIRNCAISGQNCSAVHTDYSTVNIYSGTFKGSGNNKYGLRAYGCGATINLYGGTFSGESKAIQIVGGTLTVGNLLADGYAYKQDGTTWISGDTLSGQTLTGPVEVKPVPVKITKQPANISTTYGDSASFSIEAAATEPGKKVTYQWLDKDGNEISGATGAAYTTPTGLDLGTYTYSCSVTCDGYTLKSNVATVTVSKASLPAITLDTESATYNGNAQKPAVTVGSLAEGTDYDVTYTRGNATTTDFTNAGEITVTVTGTGNYTGTATAKFTIAKAAPQIAWGSTSRELYYTGKAAEITAPTVTLVNGETFSGTISYSDAESGTSYAVLPAEAGTYQIKAGIAASGNYTAAETADMLTLTIKYYDGEIPVKFTANKNELTEAAWVSPATQVTITASGFAIAAVSAGGVCPAADEITESSITMSAQDVAKTTFYFKQDGTGYMTDGIKYELNVDGNPPGGSIELKYKFWDSFLSAISFGHYHATDKTVTITATDNESGIKTTEYVIVTGGTSYTTKEALEAANLLWQAYSSGSKPTVDVNTQSVIYAKLTDNAGNVTYLSSEGILLDTEAPAISGFAIAADSVTDEKAQISITVNETADIYLVAVPTEKARGIQAKDVIFTCDVNAIGATDGTEISNAAWHDTLAADGENLTGTREITGLAPDTQYMVYAVAVDKVIDMDKTTGSNIAYTGNVSLLSSVTLTTKKAQPVIAQTPVISGTYGQTIGTMLTPGTAKDKNGAVLTGTWTVSDADRNKTPSAGTTEEITVTFTPDDKSYDSIEVTIPMKVSPRNLSAEGVAISQVAGTYTYDNGNEIKPPVALGTGDPTKGVYISDSGATLTTGDFDVSYSNNINAGINKAVITITGKGNYTGSVTRSFTIGKAAGREIPGLTGIKTQEKDTYTYTITPTEGAVYRMGEGGEWTEKNVFTGITPGAAVTFYAKMPENENYEEGDEKSITVEFEKLTPAAPPLSYSYKTDTGTGKVTVTIDEVKGAEYSFDGGKTWGDAREQGGFDKSQTVTLAIRLKETATHNPSRLQTVEVNLAKEDRKAPDPFKLEYEANGETDYTVTIPPTEGCEYSFDGVTWSGENVKAGVAAGETVTGYKRYKENSEYNASGAVSDTETMPKFTVKTPVISPAGGTYKGSVSVTITCGTSGAEIYYTTDGSTPTGSSIRYTGPFTVTPTATVRAIAIKEGLTDSAIASASYTKPGGGSSGGGDSGDDDDDDDSGSGSGGRGTGGGDSGNTAPAAPAADTNTNPGTGTTATPATPGTGNTAKPGSQTKPGNGNTAKPGNSDTQESPTDIEKPFIKGEDGKIGWDVIRAEEEKAAEGSVINVDMNGATVVPGDIFDSIRGRDITITFDMDNGIMWSVDGKSITTDQAGDIDFSVKASTDAIPVDVINNVTGESFHIQISLAHEGEFGFTAVLSISLGRENAGYTASLYYYNQSTGELEFICKDTITEEGTASLAFTHASDYVIAIDGEESAAAEPAQPENPDGDSDAAAEETPEATQAWRPWWIVVVAGILVIVVGFGLFFVAKRKKEDEGGGGDR